MKKCSKDEVLAVCQHGTAGQPGAGVRGGGADVSPAHANPLGGTVSAGAATISGQGTPVLQVNQNSDRAVIDWKSFNIAPGETTVSRSLPPLPRFSTASTIRIPRRFSAI